MLLAIWSGELNTVSLRKHALSLAIEGHTIQTAGIVTGSLAILLLNRDLILFWVHNLNGGIFPCFDAEGLASLRVVDYIAWLVLPGPLPVCAGDFLPRDQHSHRVLALVHE